MASTSTSKAPSHPSYTGTLSSIPDAARPVTDRLDDLGYFYDTIHGRVAFGELPVEFQPALRSALSSPALDRLTRISQLGHTSLTYFSATQTRFSHAIGTLLMMNRLFDHLWPKENLPTALVREVQKQYPGAYKLCRDKATCIRCHLLLAGLYQDCGELPFQKVTSLYFRPHPNDLDSLRKRLSVATPEAWKTKDVFTLRALCQDLEDADLNKYDLNFLVFLITGDGCSPTPHLQMLRQMVDGTIDADRLDYVFRDALLTIGSLSRADTVLRSIVRYESDHVVVNDPRPAVDFLSTRARLWTFVYASPDVRFRQTLLKSFLQAGFGTEEGRKMFGKVNFISEVTLEDFLSLDDHSMLQRMREVMKRSDYEHLKETGRNACEGLLKTVTDYGCRILPKPQSGVGRKATSPLEHLPNDLFFDLLLDHGEEHKLYVPQSVRVEQALTREMREEERPVCLEECCGSFSPIFSTENRAPLVRDAFLLFKPKGARGSWDRVEKAIRDQSLYDTIDREDVRREIPFGDDTWESGRKGKKIAISCSFQDRPTVVRIVRALYAEKQQYRLLLDSLLWLGNTSFENSCQLIQEADAVLVVASQAYLKSATDNPEGNIAAEVKEIYSKNTPPKHTAVVVLPVEPYKVLKDYPRWSWGALHTKWRTDPPILAPSGGLRNAGDTTLRDVVRAAIKALNEAVR